MSDLLIGGAGFVGAYLARELLAEGRQVAVYDRDVRHSPIVQLLQPAELAGLTLLAGDVTDPVHLIRTVRELGAQRIVHLAAVLTPAGQADPATAVRVISLGTTYVLEAMRVVGAERLVWASSAQVFGPLDRYRRRHGVERILDDATPDPVTIYGACKAQAELLAAHYARTWQLNVTGLRPCGALGKGRRGGATFEVIDSLQRAVRGEPVRMQGADRVFPLMHVADVVRGLLAALRATAHCEGQTYNLGAIATTPRELAAILCQMVPNARVELEGCPTEPVAVLDAGGIERDLGFRLQHTLAEAVADVLEDAGAADQSR